MQKRTKLLIAGGVVAGLVAIGSILPGQKPEPGKVPFETRVFIKVVQQQYPDISGVQASYLGAIACEALDREGTTRFGAMREVAAEDGRTDRARYIVEAAIVNLCPEHEGRQ